MGLAQYLTGLVLGLVGLVPLVLGARRLRIALVPGWTGAPAGVADGVIVAALIVLALEVVGVLGLLTRAGVVVGCVVTGGVAWQAARQLRSRPGDGPAAPSAEPEPAVDRLDAPSAEPDRAGTARQRRPLAATVGIAAVAVVAAPWLAWTIFAYRHGMQTIDTLWYHLPFAARFVQLGNVLHLQYFDRDPVTVFYPANSELFHGFGLLLFRSDLASPAIDLGWALLAVGAAFAVGRPFGRGPHCVIAVLLVLGTPGLVDTQPGGAYNDVVCVALLLASAALLVNGAVTCAGAPRRLGRVPLPVSALAAVAAGLALGTKFTMIVPAVALGAGAVLLSGPGRRWRHAGVWVAGILGLGGYWYVRNWVVAGNPVPSLAIHLGPLSLPGPHVSTPTYTVAQYLTDGHVWTLIFIPGLRQALGPAWWALIAGATAGCGVAILRGPGVVRMLGGIAGLSGVAFLLTPQFLGLPHLPIFFTANVRYGATSLALGLVLLPILPPFRTDRGSVAWLLAAGLALLFTEIDPGVWPTGLGLKPFAAPVHGASAATGALLGVAILVVGELWLWRGWHLPRRSTAMARQAPRWLAAPVIGATLAVAGGWLIADSYASRRYAHTSPLASIYAWAQGIRHARIGVTGTDLQYPLYGRDDSNYVQYIGAPASHAGFGPITTCQQWRQVVDRGHYGWVLVTPFGFPLGSAANVAPELRWTQSSGHATAMIHEATADGALAVLYRIRGRLDPDTCPH